MQLQSRSERFYVDTHNTLSPPPGAEKIFSLGYNGSGVGVAFIATFCAKVALLLPDCCPTHYSIFALEQQQDSQRNGDEGKFFLKTIGHTKPKQCYIHLNDAKIARAWPSTQKSFFQHLCCNKVYIFAGSEFNCMGLAEK